MRGSYILFFIALLFVPTLAHAEIFTQFSSNPGGCGTEGGFTLNCSVDYKAGLFTAISCKVLTVFNNGIVPLYCNIVTSAEYLSAIHAAMALFIIIWGITFIIGTVPTTTGAAMVNLLKMSFIYAFATNSDIFFNFFYVSILTIPAEIVGIILESAKGETEFYVYVDQHFTKMFETMFMPELENGSSMKTVDVRLFVLGYAVGKLVPGGGFITGLFFTVIAGWLMTYVIIMVRYLLAIMGLIFLLMLTPIFLPAKLFKAMEFLTDEWQKMIISFILQIIVVVVYLIMIEPFFIDFMDLIKLGFNELVLEKGYEEQLISQGQTVDGGAVDAIYKSHGVTVATAEKYVTKLGYDGKDPFVPWFMFKLLVATVVIYLSYQFMKEVPRFASLIAGNPKFANLMQSLTDSDFGTGSRSHGMAHEKTLKGLQDGGAKLFNNQPSKSNVQLSNSGRGGARLKENAESAINDS